MKKVRKKKFIGAALNLVGNIASTATQAVTANKQLQEQSRQFDAQQALAREQMDMQKQFMNQQQSMAFVNSMNQAYNKDMSGMYNKYQPILRMGGKRVKRKNLDKYKSRF